MLVYQLSRGLARGCVELDARVGAWIARGCCHPVISVPVPTNEELSLRVTKCSDSRHGLAGLVLQSGKFGGVKQ